MHTKDLYDISMGTFTEHLNLDIQGYRCDPQMLFSVLTKAALDNGSLEAACDDLADVADSNTLREQLNNALDVADLPRQEVAMNAALAAELPAELPRAGGDTASIGTQCGLLSRRTMAGKNGKGGGHLIQSTAC